MKLQFLVVTKPILAEQIFTSLTILSLIRRRYVNVMGYRNSIVGESDLFSNFNFIHIVKSEGGAKDV